MADKETPDPPENDPDPQEPDQEAFWKRFRDETTKVVDARLADRDRKRSETRRSDAKRTTLPGMIANVMFGPEKK